MLLSRSDKQCIRALIALLLAALFASNVHAADPAEKSSGDACKLPDGWSEVVSHKPYYVIFGEMHGTQQGPAFFGNIACALANSGERILVAVEHDSSLNDDFQKAWDLPAAQFRAAILETDWAGRSDGVASIAMLTMLEKLHTLKLRGERINIVAFNGARNDDQKKRFSSLSGQGPHEAAQAENIRDAARAGTFDHVLILVGSLHARKLPVTGRSTSFRPMAMQLAPADRIISLLMLESGGSSWNCLLKPGAPNSGDPITSGDVDCGNHPANGNASTDKAPFVGLGTLPSQKQDASYDGFFWVGSISGSPPAVTVK